HREIQAAHHSPDAPPSLAIQFPEHRRCSRQETKKLCHHSTDTLEMPRPRGPAKPRRQPRLFDVNRAIIKIHFARTKEQIHSSVLAKFFIRGLRPWIFLKIRSRLELQWINENADCDFPGISRMFTRDANQLQVSPMQCPHRRHEDGFARSSAHMRMGGVS